MRATIYARYSSDKQSETSLSDQVAICQQHAQREDWLVVATHTDTAISGSSQVSSRPGGKGLLADALAGRFVLACAKGRLHGTIALSPEADSGIQKLVLSAAGTN